MRLMILFFAILLSSGLSAQSAEDLRGGWYADINGERHIYMLLVRDDRVSGVYCTQCGNPETLKFVDDGRLSKNGAIFFVYDDEQGQAGVELKAELIGDKLHLTPRIESASQSAETIVFQRDPFIYVGASPPGGFVPLSRPYAFPSTPVEVTAETIEGLWMAGNGPGKQYFVFKRFKGGIRGLACGPCDDTRNMAIIDDVRMDGDRLYFNILHEDSGPGFAENGPHANVTEASVASNEMHIWVVPSFEPADWTPVEMTLLGPVDFRE